MKTTRQGGKTSLLALTLLTGLLAAPGAPAATLPTQASILSDMLLANHYFTNEWPTAGCSSCLSGGHPTSIWTRGAYFEGALALYRVNHDTAITNYATQWGNFHNWTIRGGATDTTADDQCAGSEFIELYLLDTTKPYRITNIVANLNYWMFTNSTKTDWWWYIDGVHMSAPAFAKMAAISGSTNANYASKMYTYWSYCKSTIGRSNGLYNLTDHLWWRDTNYISNYKAQDGTIEKCYWSRGNGWVFAGLVRVLDVLPSGDAHFAEYRQTFQDMAAALKAVQRSDGFWNMNLGYTNDYPGPESSGTALFTYGLAWGINHGYLDEATYLQTVANGWNALAVGALHHAPTNSDPGFIGYVQSTGSYPTNNPPVTYTNVPDFDDFTLGGLLLAGSEIYQLASHAQLITFNTLGSPTYGDGTITLNASASSGLPVSFSLLSGPASLAGNVLTITGAGTVTVRASQAGNSTWDPAPNVDQSFTVNPKALTVTGTLSAPASKVYDGTTNATVSGTPALQAAEAPGPGTSSDGKPYSADSVSLTGTPTYAYNSKDVASASTVNVSGLSLTGTGSGNYTLNPQVLSATITPKTLTMSGLSVPASKTYDGTMTAVVSGSPGTLQTAETAGTGTTDDGRRYSVDSVTLTGTATGAYNSPDVATANTVTFAAVSLTGTGSGNYTLTIQSPAAATITGRSLTVTTTGVNKVYDGTTAATVTLSDNRVSGDVLTTSYASALFAGKDVGTGKAISVSGISVTGADAGDYTLGNTTAAASANITPLPVQLSGSHVYDGTTTAAAASLSIANKVAGDDVSLSGTAALAGKNVGSQAVSASTGPARVQFTSGSVNSGTSISMTALSASPTAGNTLVAVISTRGTSQNQVNSITQSGATWSRVTQSGAGSTTTSTTEIWYAPNVSSSAGTAITIGLATTLRAAAVVVEYSGLLTPTSSDVSTNNYSAGTKGTTAATGTTAGTAQANELWFAGIGFTNSSYTLSSFQNSFSRITDVSSTSSTSANNARVYALERIVTASGTASSGGTISTSSQWSGAVATFKSVPVTVLTLTGTTASDYTVTGLTGSVTITAKPLTVTGLSVPATKPYDGTTATATPIGSPASGTAEAPGSGTSDDGLPYTGDTVTISGTATGTYNAADVDTANLVTFTGLSTANSNYTLTPPTQAATITPKLLTTALTGTASKPYDGTTAATLMAGNYSLPGVLSGDTVSLNNPASGTYDTKDVGAAKTVTVTGLAISGASVDDYALSSPSASGPIGAITPAALGITADPKSKTYGDDDPALTYQVTSGLLASGDGFTGSLSRAAGENVGAHAILQGSVTAGANYTLSFHGADLTINPKPITATADPKSKTYGDPDPALTYQLTGTLVGSDTLAGDLTREAGENAGTYAIQQGTLAASANYTLSYQPANFTITRRDLLAQADDTGRAYGQTNPVFTITCTGFIGTDAVTNLAELPQATTSADTNSPIGTYDITLSGGSDTNYSLVLSNGTLTVTTAALTVTADPQSKTYGDPDPALTWKITTGALLGADAVLGVLGRDTGEDAGTYAIQQNTLTAGTNYTLTFVPANLTINPKAITVTADPKSKVYSETDPALTYQLSAPLVGNDALTGNLTREAGEDAGLYAIQQGTLAAGANYNVGFVSANLTINPATTATALASSQNPCQHGASVSLAATSSPVAPATATPEGNVQFYVNDVAQGGPVALSAGGAVLDTTTLPAGTNTVKAVFLGSMNFLGSTGTVAQAVMQQVQPPGNVQIEINSDTITLRFPGTAQADYVVQAVDDLATGSWQNISTNTASADGTCTLTISTAGHSQRFFRAVQR